MDENSRKKFDMFLREIEGQFPRKFTVFEYYVDPAKRGWALWEDKVNYTFSLLFLSLLLSSLLLSFANFVLDCLTMEISSRYPIL